MRVELTLLLWAFGALLVWGLLTGRIATRGVLSAPGEDGPSGNNVQLLITTCLAAGYYLLRAMETAKTHVMPEVPEELLLFVAGSHIAFTGVRIRSLFKQ